MRRNPQHDAADRRFEYETSRAFRRKIASPDARGLGVATRLTAPEVLQASVTELQNDDGDFYIVWGHSRFDSEDVFA